YFPRADVAMRFEAAVRWEMRNPQEDRGVVRARLRVRNVGRATARDAFVTVQSNAPPNRPEDFSPIERFGRWPMGRDRVGFSAHLPIHPGQVFDVFDLGFITGTSTGIVRPTCGEIRFDLRFYAEDCEEQVHSLTFDPGRVEITECEE